MAREAWKNDPLAQETEEPRYTAGTQESENLASSYFIGGFVEYEFEKKQKVEDNRFGFENRPVEFTNEIGAG